MAKHNPDIFACIGEDITGTTGIMAFADDTGNPIPMVCMDPVTAVPKPKS